MADTRSSHLADSDSPTPARHLQLYSRFWDIASLLAFGLYAIVIVFAQLDTLTWREIVASGLCLAQGILYFWVIARNPRPNPPFQLGLYFVGGLSLWTLACQLSPFLWWLGFMYLGQMFVLLPPVAVVFGSAILTILMALAISNWNIIQISVGTAIGFTFQWLAGAASYLFIYATIRTSRERAQLITKLETAQKELELTRQRDAELAALRERERLARDLHDSLGHTLVTLSIQLEAVQRLYKVDPERASAQVNDLKHITRTSMDELRRSLAGLRSPGLGERRLSDALQALSAEVGQRAHLEISCHVSEAADQLSPPQAEALWRVSQEALTNIERHAEAHNVKIKLDIESQIVSLFISDDGRSLPPNAENQPGHYGLRGMRERVEGLGGELTFSSNGNNGTRVTVKLPTL